MKIKTIVLILSISALAFFFNACGSSDKKTNGTEQNTGDKAAYFCPMKCEGEKTYDKMGKCPVCEMDLEEKEGTSTH